MSGRGTELRIGILQNPNPSPLTLALFRHPPSFLGACMRHPRNGVHRVSVAPQPLGRVGLMLRGSSCTTSPRLRSVEAQSGVTAVCRSIAAVPRRGTELFERVGKEGRTTSTTHRRRVLKQAYLHLVVDRLAASRRLDLPGHLEAENASGRRRTLKNLQRNNEASQ
ncbi:hypothetical protein AAT19DRAFT_10849 [Rhodotorula toruloides]|uniref:Uncharacterized protein n=1 Tax=Rhodotorula toruloides TaxID=5286 RepID=A0A2S9ZY71_RHOTO|nr:hypothetical protein AAT19DRAFT_10849 [Rhodotorula toruloides]